MNVTKSLRIDLWGSLTIQVVLAFATSSVQATETVKLIAGSLSSSENSCSQVIRLLTLRDCSYGNDFVQPSGWIGPFVTSAYYAPGSAGDSTGYIPSAGDARIRPNLSGTLTIENSDTETGSDDIISGTLSIGPAARLVEFSTVRRTVERWDSMTHYLQPTAVNSATPNGFGGWDYVIGAKGFPDLICSQADTADCFASENATNVRTPLFDLTNFWAGPGTVGIERSAVLGGNAGPSTVATFVNYSCEETGFFGCTSDFVNWQSLLEDPGFDNLLLRIVTDGSGNILTGDAFWTQEYRIQVGTTLVGDNSWHAGTFTFAGTVVPAPPAVWLLGTALAGLGGRQWLRRKATT